MRWTASIRCSFKDVGGTLISRRLVRSYRCIRYRLTPDSTSTQRSSPGIKKEHEVIGSSAMSRHGSLKTKAEITSRFPIFSLGIERFTFNEPTQRLPPGENIHASLVIDDAHHLVILAKVETPSVFHRIRTLRNNVTEFPHREFNLR